MTRRTPILLFILACAALLAGCDPSKNPNVEAREVEVGYRGPARSNPFLATERFLEKMGLDADEHFSLTEMPPSDVVLIVPAEGVAADGVARRLLDWVSEGGHLIYLLDGADSLKDDWETEIHPRSEAKKDDEADPAAADGEDDAEIDSRTVADLEDIPNGSIFASRPDSHPLLDRLDVELTTRDGKTESVMFPGGELAVEIPNGRGFAVPTWRAGSEAVVRGGPEDAQAVLSFYHEEGRITLMADAWPWRNRYIGVADHARLLWDLINLDGPAGSVWIMRGTRASFASLLFKHARMPLLALAVFVIFWLWRSMPRFGPVIPTAPAVTREFTQHLAMAGNFLWKRRALDSLLEPARRRVLKRFRERSVLENGEIIEEALPELVEASGLSAKRVREALKLKEFRDPNQLTTILRDLQKMDTST